VFEAGPLPVRFNRGYLEGNVPSLPIFVSEERGKRRSVSLPLPNWKPVDLPAPPIVKQPFAGRAVSCLRTKRRDWRMFMARQVHGRYFCGSMSQDGEVSPSGSPPLNPIGCHPSSAPRGTLHEKQSAPCACPQSRQDHGIDWGQPTIYKLTSANDKSLQDYPTRNGRAISPIIHEIQRKYLLSRRDL
jgi:hypothetical protein